MLLLKSIHLRYLNAFHTVALSKPHTKPAAKVGPTTQPKEGRYANPGKPGKPRKFGKSEKPKRRKR